MFQGFIDLYSAVKIKHQDYDGLGGGGVVCSFSCFGAFGNISAENRLATALTDLRPLDSRLEA